MPSEPVVPTSAAHTADAEDGGWTLESASAGVTASPDDTTAAAIAAEVAEVSDEPAPAVTPAHEDDSLESASQTPEGQPPAAAVEIKAADAPPKRKESVQQRIDKAVAAQRAAERREAQARTNAEQLHQRLEALEKGTKPAVQPGTDGRPSVAVTPAADPMPAHPVYTEFDTEEAYRTAEATWQTNMVAWQGRQTERLKAEITSGLDERLTRDRAEVDRAAHEATVAARIRAVKEAHPDFDDKLAAQAETFAAITPTTNPFLFDIIQNTAEGAEFFYDLAATPEMVAALSDLPIPTRALAHAVRRSPAARALMKYFASDQGRDDFMHLRTLQDPGEVFLAVGALQASLTTAVRGPASGVAPITHAAPPAKPPVGAPRAREPQPGSDAATVPFESWMEEMDRKDQAKKFRELGLPVPA